VAWQHNTALSDALVARPHLVSCSFCIGVSISITGAGIANWRLHIFSIGIKRKDKFIAKFIASQSLLDYFAIHTALYSPNEWQIHNTNININNQHK